MTLDTRDLRRQAGERLQEGQNPKRLVLIHTAVALGAVLLATALNWLFNKLIAGTGGLRGLELRTVLTTIQWALWLAVLVCLPLWEKGLVFAALSWADGDSVGAPHLLQGFRRMGSLLSMRLIRCALCLALGVAIFNFSTIVFMMSPFSTPLMEYLEPLVKDATTPEQVQALLTPELVAEATEMTLPLLVIFGVLYLAVAIPVFYRLRFADYAVMEGKGAVRALVQSARLTQGSTLQLMKLDLSFWWYYLLLGLCVVISVGDTCLSWLGISLPLSQDAGFFLFYVLGMVCQGVLLWQCCGQVNTTYALAYRTLGQPPVMPQKAEPPASVPWEQ